MSFTKLALLASSAVVAASAHGGVCHDHEFDDYLTCNATVHLNYTASSAALTLGLINATNETAAELNKEFWCTLMPDLAARDVACIQDCIPNTQYDDGSRSVAAFFTEINYVNETAANGCPQPLPATTASKAPTSAASFASLSQGFAAVAAVASTMVAVVLA